MELFNTCIIMVLKEQVLMQQIKWQISKERIN